MLLVASLAGCSASSGPNASATTKTTIGAPTSRSAAAMAGGGSAAPTGPPAPATSAGAGSTATPSIAQIDTKPCGWVTKPPATYRHVVWILMENHTWSQVLGNRSAAPYEVALAARCATATRFDNVGSPSLPNYIGATSGSTQAISDDGPPSSHPLTVDNLFRQVRDSGGTERSYEESMTRPCQPVSAGNYAVKHNPAAYYLATGGGDREACNNDDVSFPHLVADLQSDQLPTFSFVTPNLCDDTHDCAVPTGDAWLAREVPLILHSPAYRRGTTAVFVVWDEYSPVPNIVIAPAVGPGTVATAAMNDFSLLRTTEDLLGLPDHLGAAAAAPSLRPVFGL